ncbi:hypothetical protein, partial [Helicobacter sp. T3_23-1059]
KRLKYFNKLEHIYNLAEAVAFLKALPKRAKKDFIKYASKNPQIACKIAYIYYRFDLGNDKFVSSVEGKNGEYVSDRKNFIETSHSVLQNNSIGEVQNLKIIVKYNELLTSDNVNLKANFIVGLTFKVCNTFGLPLKEVIFYSDNENSYGFCEPKTKKIYFNKRHLYHQNIFREMVDTVFHEIRHFYIYQYITKPLKKNTKTFGSLITYLGVSANYYIDDNVNAKTNIFRSFYKICYKYDAKSVGCEKNNEQEIYEIQPNERDPRYVATKIMAILP